MNNQFAINLRTPIPWITIDAPIYNESGNRSVEHYNLVIDQFDVESNPRYIPREGKTYCNIFVWDVTRAMRAEIPHWTNTLGEPVSHDFYGAIRKSCNSMYYWLYSLGSKYGWYKADISRAIIFASQGKPSIAIYHNPHGNGHIAIILPDQPTDDGPFCAQAGKQCYRRIHLKIAFGDKTPEFWIHE
jgi:hypothetical protein